MADDRQPPLAVQAAAKVIEDYLRGAPPVLGNAPRPETAAQRFARLPRGDKPTPQPAWKDPRSV